jgi:hypothetical protein
MRLLGRFAIGLLLIGLGLGWWARRRWGPLRSLAPWAAALALAPLHAVIVGVRGVSIGADAAALLTYAVATVVLLAAAVRRHRLDPEGPPALVGARAPRAGPAAGAGDQRPWPCLRRRRCRPTRAR